MREIKFRAWDPESYDNGYMVYSDGRDKKNWPCGYDFWFDNENKLACRWYKDYDDSFGYPQENSGILADIMQFTGLRDKNGVEIYEGDIIQTYFSFDPGDAGYGVSQKPFVVDWNQEHASFRAKKPEAEAGSLHLLDIISFFSMQSRLYEVIGNIHENPELLEPQPCG